MCVSWVLVSVCVLPSLLCLCRGFLVKKVLREGGSLLVRGVSRDLMETLTDDIYVFC